MTKKFLIVVIILAGFFTVVSSANALTLYPSRLEAEINPGQTEGYSFFLFNETKDDLHLTATVESFKPQGEAGGVTILPPDISNQSLSWIKLPQGVVLKPGQTKQIDFTISVPSTAGVGGYYMAIMWQGQQGSGNKSVAITSRVGALVLLRVKGGASQKLNLSEFGLKDHKNVYNFLPISFVSRLENKGNIHLKPSGMIIIKNIFGRVVSTVPFNAPGNNVLPQSARQFENIWSGGRLDGHSGFFSAWARELKPSAWGRFTAELDLEFGNPRQSINSKSVSFWIIPWRTLATIIVVIILILIIIIKRRSRK